MSPRKNDLYQVGVVCALPKEMAAARAILDEEHEPLQVKDTQDSNCYVLGKLCKHHIVIACLPAGEYGVTAAATVANDMLGTFTKIRFGLMVGIGGGVPDLGNGKYIRLGDVVVSQPDRTHGGVVQYDLVKDLGRDRLERKGFLNRPPTSLLTALSTLQAKPKSSRERIADHVNLVIQHPDLVGEGYAFPGVEHDNLYCAACDWTPWQMWWWVLLLLSWILPFWSCRFCVGGKILRPVDRISPQVHYGTIASGSSLIKNAARRDHLRDELGAKCIEMEAAGLMNKFPCLVIRGICDYADAHKNDVWQKYAAATAAAFAKELLSFITPTMVADVKISAIDSINNQTNDSLQESVRLQEETLNLKRMELKQSEEQERIKRERHCLQLFNTSDNPYKDFKDINPDRADKTCLWVLDHQQFRRWHDNAQNDLLWISADPGCGKSVLSKHLVDYELATLQHTTTRYYFFKDNERQNRLAPALRAVLHQLFSRQPALLRYATEIWERNGDQIREDAGTMWEILLKAATDKDADNVVCIFDALDECCDGDRKDLITRLCKFHERPLEFVHAAALKFLVTSRPLDNVLHHFEQNISRLPQMRIYGEDENDAIHMEINFVIEKEVDKLASEFKLSGESRDRLLKTLLDMKHRTYLWLKLTMDGIRKQFYGALLPDTVQIEHLPPTVSDAYEALLQRIDKVDVRNARKVISIIVGARRSLHIAEMALALGSASAHRDCTLHIPEVDQELLMKRIRQWCGLFIFINHSRLFLIHQTAKDFLLTKISSHDTGGDMWRSSLLVTDVESELAKICVTYLSLVVMERDLLYEKICHEEVLFEEQGTSDDVSPQSSFYQYCAKHWMLHLDDHSIRDDEKLLNAVLELYDTTGERFQAWYRVFLSANLPTSIIYDQHVIAMSGHAVVLAERYRRQAFDIELRDGTDRTALIWAAERGHIEVMQILLSKGADINAQGSKHGNALQAASRGGNEETVRMLLDRGADVNDQGGKWGNALRVALCHGRELVVRLLLDMGADVNARIEQGGDALSWAIERDQVEIVQMLLEKGANVYAEVKQSTALEEASRTGKEEIVQLLLLSLFPNPRERQDVDQFRRALLQDNTAVIPATVSDERNAEFLDQCTKLKLSSFEKINKRLVRYRVKGEWRYLRTS